jgi:hypothetical protein
VILHACTGPCKCSDGPECGDALPPDPTLTAVTGLAQDALRTHLRLTVDCMLALGHDGPEAVAQWRGYWGDVLDSIAADTER